MTPRSLTFAAAVAVLLACTGCSRSPAVNFYTLEAAAKGEGGAARPVPSVSVGPVSVPELVNRPQLVIRVAPNRVAVLESERWAEPLKSELPRLIAQNLGTLLGSSRVASYQELSNADADFRVLLDFTRFEAARGDAVSLEIDWSVRRTAAGTGTPWRGHSSVRERISGAGYDATVAAYNRALLRVSGDIAAAIRREGGLAVPVE